MKERNKYIIILGTIAIGSTVGIFTKSAALYPFLSWHYCLFVGGAILNLGVYAILWQQIIQRIEISTAYMFRGAGVIFCLSFCALIFGESITINNIIGAAIIILGITMYAIIDSKEKEIETKE